MIFLFEALFGNKSIQKILLFLFVNEKCYASQLARNLNAPLTPIQKALSRLEKGSIIKSYLEGKTRVYQFNLAFPLITELEALLKKSYSLIPSQEKKRYYLMSRGMDQKQMPAQEVQEKGKRDRQLLNLVWNKLGSICQVTFSTKSKSKGCSNRIGKGIVTVLKESPTVLIFQEQGTSCSDNGEEFNFTNAIRWSLDLSEGLISLEHLRLGINYPVFLLHLVPTGPNVLDSLNSHLCEKDAYYGRMFYGEHFLQYHWRILGPEKNEIIDYLYI